MNNIFKRITQYEHNHKWVRFLKEHTIGMFICALSAFVLTIGIKSFVAPPFEIVSESGTTLVNLPKLIAGGGSGIAQVFVKIFQVTGIFDNQAAIWGQWVFYGIVNIPLIIIAFIMVGKKFTFYSMLNIALSILFSFVIPEEFYTTIAVIFAGQFVPRAIFGGALVGFSSGVAFRFGQSAGGMDIIGHVLASKKSVATGRYTLIINSSVMLTFIVLSTIFPDDGQRFAMAQYHDIFNGWPLGTTAISSFDPSALERVAFFLIIVFCSFLYILVSAMVMDLINLRNKKEQLQITTRNKDLPDILIHSFKHGVTTVAGRGEFTKESKVIIYMTVSHYETAEVIALVKENDPEAFTNVTNLRQVYGRFFIPPLK